MSDKDKKKLYLDLESFIEAQKLSIWLYSAIGIAYSIVKQYRAYTDGQFMPVTEWFATIFVVIYVATILYIAKRIKFLREQDNKPGNKNRK